MKKMLLGTIGSLLISACAMAGTPVKRLVPVSGVYAPFGFDSNDNTEVVVEGYLPNLCHKTPMTNVKVDGNKIDIQVSSLYYQESNPYCPEMVVPFVEAVDVGVLDKGKYEITVNGKSPFEQKSEISIAENTSDAVDDMVYANVEYIEQDLDSNTVKMKGHNPSDCFVFDRFEVANNKVNAYSVQPIMKQVSDFCPMKLVPFELEFNVPKVVKKEKVLLHVRVMNGKSVNSIFKRR